MLPPKRNSLTWILTRGDRYYSEEESYSFESIHHNGHEVKSPRTNDIPSENEALNPNYDTIWINMKCFVIYMNGNLYSS